MQAVEEIAGLGGRPETRPGPRYSLADRRMQGTQAHLVGLGVAGHEVGFDTLLMYTWRDREVVMDLLCNLVR